MTTPQQQENRVSLLTKCAEFYSDKKNYEKNPDTGKSLIDLDSGHIAKSSLNIIAMLKKAEEEMDEVIKMVESDDSLTGEGVLLKIKEITDKIKLA